MAKPCERAGCDRPARARGMCMVHYERERGRDRQRDRTARLLPNRARSRAATRLIRAHAAEFDRLYREALAEVEAEDRRLAELCEEEGAEPTGDRKVWRLKPGPRPEDEEPEDRATRPERQPDCRDCATWHACGHACATCSAPAPKPGSREDVEARMRCQQCGLDGSARRRPCVGVRARDGATIEYAAHDYTLEARRA